MRLHEEPEDAPATSPIPARATAEEFAAAVAALEARNSEAGKAGGLSSTVDIAEAVRELGLEADPEDVWAEVQDQRARRAGAQAARRPVATRKRLVRVAAMLAGLIALVTGVLIDGRVIARICVIKARPLPLPPGPCCLRSLTACRSTPRGQTLPASYTGTVRRRRWFQKRWLLSPMDSHPT